MATSGTMDDSFRSRVETIFGSLTTGPSQAPPSAASPLPSQSNAMWSLTDEEVEKREWKRGGAGTNSDRDDIPCSSSFDDPICNRNRRRRMLSDLYHDEEEEVEGDGDGRRRRGGGGGGGVDEWEIRSSIGMDRTLDNEEEEDEYDKVAEGREDEGDRLYLKAVVDEGSYLNLHKAIPKSSYGVRDQCANRLAAKIRMQEDDAEVWKLDSHHDGHQEVEEVCVLATVEEGRQVRSILKRKDNSSDSKSSKRVRFDPSCKTVCLEDASDSAEGVFKDTSSGDAMITDDGCAPTHFAFGVPDYIRNPSKYTRYSLDSASEVDEKSNSQAYLDFLKLIRRSKPGGLQPEEEDASGGLPKSVTFIPKKKTSEFKVGNGNKEVKQDTEDDVNQSAHQAGIAVGIAAGKSLEPEVGAMEEDEQETQTADKGFRKPGRRYRTKSCSEDTD